MLREEFIRTVIYEYIWEISVRTLFVLDGSCRILLVELCKPNVLLRDLCYAVAPVGDLGLWFCS